MNKISFYFLSFLFSLSICASSQTPEWFASGTTWTYNFGIPTGPDNYTVTYEVEGPVEFSGHSCYTLAYSAGTNLLLCSAPDEGPFYFYESNDSVFYATPQNPDFSLLFDFSAGVGDSWNVAINTNFGAGHIVYTVLQKETENIDGVDLIKLTLEGTASEATGIAIENPVVVYETLGATSYFFAPLGHISFADCVTMPVLQCSDSPSLNYLNPDFENCEVITGIRDINGLNFSVGPNPAQDYLKFSASESVSTMSIVDLQGKVVLERAINSSYGSLSVSELPSGVYLLVALTDKGLIKNQFIKK